MALERVYTGPAPYEAAKLKLAANRRCVIHNAHFSFRVELMVELMVLSPRDAGCGARRCGGTWTVCGRPWRTVPG